MAKKQENAESESNRDKGPICADAVVPRVVHQIWVQGNPTGEAGELISKTREVCMREGWSHRLWYATGFCGVLEAVATDPWLGKFSVLEEHHDSLWGDLELRCATVSTKADLIRVILLHAFGGLYLDADVKLWRLPVELRGAWIAPFGSLSPIQVNNAVWAQPAGHPFGARVLSAIKTNPVTFCAHRFPGPSYAQACLGPDVTVWSESHWHGLGASYGNHLCRNVPWRSQRVEGES